MRPDGAMREARHAAILRWLEATSPAEVTASCAEASLPGTLVLDCCLAEAPLAWLAEVALRTPLRVALEGCTTPDAARGHVGEVARLTSRITLDGGPGAGAPVRYAAPPARRRGLLGLGRTAPGPTGTHQQRLAAALAALPLDPEAPSDAANLSATSACTACGVCVRACPHEALTLEVADGVATLTQRTDTCEGELACVALCPHDALHSDGARRWAEVGAPAELTVLPVRTCASCQSPFPASSPGELCQVCQDQEASPFTVNLPPAARALLEQRRRKRGSS